MLRVENLNVWFGFPPDRVDAVQSVSFQVPQGQSYGLVGESGSGKSTILRAITGLIDTWSGDIRVADQAVAGRKRSRAFHKAVQMVFQDPYASLHPRHSVDRVLSETLHLQGMHDIDRRIAQLLDAVGLGSGFRFRYPHQLSGGQRQRVAIARALAAEPRLLLLDEPTSALDVSVQAEILNLLADLRRERGLTYVMVSHDLSVVAHMCDRLAVMRQGRIVEEMDAASLRAGRAQSEYARELLTASASYDRGWSGA
ncbi:ABC transporter ATP-binding protein [Paracoccus laeviglucosivorans]|uniref:Glutathione import ATP-binding protein GsiA n=1 Tax=Paracoccus laeviglucosivorans TaxID=1197861 RepID=A0A521BPE0_9RHOB|nr:ABC transporter ATP-binding protein [Paracoccus laeviglucosivorans]SMO49022.1 peptide/nickel transport system ATP-binding protein [Paracoccus laeviglucosivorans]